MRNARAGGADALALFDPPFADEPAGGDDDLLSLHPTIASSATALSKIRLVVTVVNVVVKDDGFL